jgi:hypothetical protein
VASLQRWETAWPNDPRSFIAPQVIAPVVDLNAQKTHEWNISVQKALPFESALTVSYVGNRSLDAITGYRYNDLPPGYYANLQNARPYPRLGDGYVYLNQGETWYNALQLKLERRFTRGFSYAMSYAFSKLLMNDTETEHTGTPEPFAPAGYNRGRSDLDRTHIFAVNGIWEIPFGQGRAFGDHIHPVLNGVLGGWQINGLYLFQSGPPLRFIAPGATLGNGRNSRATALRNPSLSNPSADLWFDPAALTIPAPFKFGNSGIGLMDGPGLHSLNTGLTKDFHVAEARFLQFRWEMFNATNHVNLSTPTTNVGLATTGKIFSAAAARQMQFGLKFIF